MRNRPKKLIQGMLLLTTTLIIIILGASAMGSADITPFDCSKILISKLPFIGSFVPVTDIKESSQLIVMNIRLPRILLSALIGAALATSGAVFQGIFKNPMADPYVLGVSSGAAVGATVVIVIGITGGLLGYSAITIGAFIGALLTALLVFTISRVGNKTPVVTLLLAGIAVNFFLSAVISTVMSMNQDKMENIIFWTMGSVATANWTKIINTGIPVVLGILLMLFFARDLNAMALGDESAKNLGVDAEVLKKRLLVLSSIVTASAVSVSGIIGFVGLVVPHVVRIISGPDHRTLLPFSVVGGAIFMVVADTLSRMLIAPAEMPLGVITSLFGAPYFLFLLYKSKSKMMGR